MLGWVQLPQVPQRLRSYEALRLPTVFVAPSGLPLGASTLAGRLFSQTTCASSYTLPAGDFLWGSPPNPNLFQGTVGSLRLPGRPLSARRDQTPRRLQSRLCPLAPRLLLPSWNTNHWAVENKTISGLTPSAPRLRLPTHQPLDCSGSSKATYQPAGLGSSWVGFAPTGRLRRNFKVASLSSYSARPGIA